MGYVANEARYEGVEYRKCGESGLHLPPVSLGLWHNFGDNADYDTMCRMLTSNIPFFLQNDFTKRTKRTTLS